MASADASEALTDAEIASVWLRICAALWTRTQGSRDAKLRDDALQALHAAAREYAKAAT